MADPVIRFTARRVARSLRRTQYAAVRLAWYLGAWDVLRDHTAASEGKLATHADISEQLLARLDDTLSAIEKHLTTDPASAS